MTPINDILSIHIVYHSSLHEHIPGCALLAING